MQRTLDQVVAKHGANGPQTGIFTDGSAEPNPGPGGWGVVAVSDGRVLWRARGSSRGKQTTNNRMEMSAIIAALRRVPPSAQAVLYSDSNLCVQTLNDWAPRWAANGWRRNQNAEVKNEDLVREAYALKTERPGVNIRWQKAHAGATWNEYADRLADGWRHD